MFSVVSLLPVCYVVAIDHTWIAASEEGRCLSVEKARHLFDPQAPVATAEGGRRRSASRGEDVEGRAGVLFWGEKM